jgi:hypothetical protein
MRTALLSTFILCAASAAAAQTQPVRPSDPDVRGVIYAVDQARGRFEDALDGDLKRSILRSPTGEVNVARYLEDLQRNAGLMKDRFKDNYAASQEVLTFLKQCTGLHTWVSSQPSTFKGRSEWESMAVLLGNLATMYGTKFPVPEGATSRRMNDKEVAQAAELAAKSADEFRKAAAKTMKAAKADPQAVAAMEREMKTLTAQAKALKSKVGGHKASSNEARVLLEQATRTQTAVTPPAAPDPAAAHWATLQTNLQSIRLAYGMAGA